ncbi:N-Dimethylarginine dimethylaminohydrolase [Rhodoblastus acidophilus]|uniref:N-Dimethylarginine dimethylaminohydrolase n=1 Tax=Rhodoblastus acidophilus TaxID=1074 RepID=A0A212RT33_RHOAC|nr:arginine deiminase-related protein [Rhodoblastus acidophilus]PPQ40718.1 nitrate reductase [Rhodoblastus acidophilus]RAI21904.1 nitrate reductase [Rhodoblastus acidophilus]SNB75837.1 N-Dimethylarginine dimethylaminohydrolase [Rhodoblastus acidophilus]
MTNRPHFLMCPPDFFGVSYVINPWMEGQTGHTDAAAARAQWTALRDALARAADVSLIAPHPGLPDLVFTANAGLVIGARALLSRFRCPQRRGEEPLFRSWFEKAGFEVVAPPHETCFEGAGDALLDESRDVIWLGHGFRSDAAVAPLVAQAFGRETIPLRLIDSRFYHLDTCFCPLPGGVLLYFPGAFDQDSRAAIEARAAPDQRIAVDESDAAKFCCNAVALGDSLLLNDASPVLREKLRAKGLTPVALPFGEFIKAGGAAKCLTLRI